MWAADSCVPLEQNPSYSAEFGRVQDDFFLRKKQLGRRGEGTAIWKLP